MAPDDSNPAVKKCNIKRHSTTPGSDRRAPRLDHERPCELLYFDESGFSPNPPVQYREQIGQTRAFETLAHRRLDWGIASQWPVDLDYSAATDDT
ncbi:hypothetical protein [Massilia sp. LjRoot122]|uniref:hypothetical protein n=1 Tax=Massilia sp. LjRoot122 TaxID=3342257 RepID=UPI003ED0BAF2